MGLRGLARFMNATSVPRFQHQDADAGCPWSLSTPTGRSWPWRASGGRRSRSSGCIFSVRLEPSSSDVVVSNATLHHLPDTHAHWGHCAPIVWPPPLTYGQVQRVSGDVLSGRVLRRLLA